jgi:uncharacterized membrane protein YfcA
VTLDPILLIGLLFVVSVSALVNGALGFGFALLAVNVLAIVLGTKEAVIVMSLVTPAMSGLQLVRHRRHAPDWRRFRTLLVAALVGSIAGTQLLVLLPAPMIGLALGAFTIYYVATSLRKERPPIAGSTEQRLAPVAGFIGGVTNSTIGASGPVFGSYLIALGLRGREFAFAISISFFSMGLLRIGLLAALDQYTAPLVTSAAAMFVPALASQRVGFWLQSRAPIHLLHRAVLIVLLVASANLLWRGVSAFLG